MPETRNLPQIEISIEHDNWPDAGILTGWVETAVAETAETASLEWPAGAELSLLFTNDDEMAAINGQWRDKPVATNVLSFPGGDVSIGEPSGPMIGDLVFAHETIVREAQEQGKTFQDHFIHLVVHGFLHLFGYDHIEDQEAEIMENLETRILSHLGIADPYT